MRNENKTKEIKGEVPYNAMNLRTCYYSQLMAGYSSFGVDTDIILSNYFPIYKYDKAVNDMEIEMKQILNDKLLQRLIGVKKVFIKKINKFTNFVCKNIDKDRPMLIPCDSYYLDFRVDTYKKVHIMHYILVYGYDLNENKFIVNEHNYIKNFYYERRLVDIDCIEKAFREYENRLSKANSFNTIMLKKARKGKIKATNNISLIANEIKESKEGLSLYLDYVISCLKDDEKLLSGVEDIQTFLGNNRWAKMQQRNVIHNFSNNETAKQVADRLVENYIFIHAVIAKIKFSKKINRKSIEKAILRCEELREKEELLHELFVKEKLKAVA